MRRRRGGAGWRDGPPLCYRGDMNTWFKSCPRAPVRRMAAGAAPALAVLLFSCAELKFELPRFEDGGVTAPAVETTFTIPLLPVDLPIYPTDLTASGLADSVAGQLGALGVPAIAQGAVRPLLDSGVSALESKLKQASLEILQPGVLSADVGGRFAALAREQVQITRVVMTMVLANETKELVSTPTEFRLYAGEAKLAEAWDESTAIGFVALRPGGASGAMVIAPGELVTVTAGDIPHLTKALNGASSLGVGYKNLYRVVDTGNGADAVGAAKVFGPCVLALSNVPGFDAAKDCPPPDRLAAWKLTMKKFEVAITAKKSIELPPVPSCREFAAKYKLDVLAKACPAAAP
ncbi:MAG: hypothetical protein GMKNLPBB_03357 [Myxococcota bacterium]|nr:hypothetical protein [Myxococcota bacterium]